MNRNNIDLSKLRKDQGSIISSNSKAKIMSTDIVDFNGDGSVDIVLGTVEITETGAEGSNKFYVIYGKDGGFDNIDDFTTITQKQGIIISDTGGSYGCSVSNVGDINSDGVDDIVLMSKKSTRVCPGRVKLSGDGYLLFGKNTTLPNNAFSNIDLSKLTQAQGIAGQNITTAYAAGDVNGDGIGDIVFGDHDVAKCYVLNGKNSTLTKNNWPSIEVTSLTKTNGFFARGEVGTYVSTVGDINHDGLDDVIFGTDLLSPLTDWSKGPLNSAYVVYGKNHTQGGQSDIMDLSNMSNTQGFNITYPSGLGNYAITTGFNLGDINNDKIDDFAVVSPCAAQNSVFVLYGKGGNFKNIDLTRLNKNDGFSINHISGSVARTCDINGDGIKDIIISSICGNSPAMYVIYGKNGKSNDISINGIPEDSLTENQGFVVRNPKATEYLSYSVSCAGDINSAHEHEASDL